VRRPVHNSLWVSLGIGIACSLVTAPAVSGSSETLLETSSLNAAAAEDGTPRAQDMPMQQWRSWFNPDAAVSGVAPRSLQEAIRKDNPDELQSLLDEGWNPDGLTDVRETPLELAIRLGRVDFAEQLLRGGANPNHGSRATQTIPLQLAIRNRDAAMVQALLEAGAKVDTRVPRTLRTPLANTDDSPLHEAATIGNLDIARVLLASSARVNITNHAGLTPLHHAIAANHVELAEFLLDSGAELNARGRVGTTPLHLAAIEGSVDAVRLLLERGAEVNTSTRNGSTPLHGAINRGHTEIVALLIAHSADRSRVGITGETPISAARRLGHESIIRLLESGR
jgi:ankyrin repeat protein